MRITSKGQVTIPVDIRRQAGLLPNTEVEFVLEHGKVVLRSADGLTRGQRLVERLSQAGAGALRTADEVMELTRGPLDDVGDPHVSTGVHEPDRRFRET
ncbi:AbrB/MazE/SpoVT family DNA-binding domain-containing protein [Brevundimonas sp. AJA228-03]|uniref:AbrB/MazE/SpoVT family DNA-binding domain-containing protein n=1 Tax=Brevundimonas sp. AJA228-03 TaxID=2752515 RepID=UPI001ADF873C|nr:AbrB/MazE/SpoVT family DNA-binding domain-containing protein [Brevundimonas sp. AJA228-03]